MFRTRAWKNKVREEIEYYERTIIEITNQYSAAESLEEREKYRSQLDIGRSYIAFLRQWELIRELDESPLEVPSEYWLDCEVTHERRLTPKGIAWARHELKKLSHTEIEFWFKLVIPVAALVISIIALVHSYHLK